MLYIAHCGVSAELSSKVHCPEDSFAPWGEVRSFAWSAIPTRGQLRELDHLAERFVVGETPSLAEIAAQPDVAHQAEPVADPHPVSEPVRLVLEGSSSALAAVVTKLMRLDALWVEVAFVPRESSAEGASDYESAQKSERSSAQRNERNSKHGEESVQAESVSVREILEKSTIAQLWGLEQCARHSESNSCASTDANSNVDADANINSDTYAGSNDADAATLRVLWEHAVSAAALPTALIRDDQGQVTLGSATITARKNRSSGALSGATSSARTGAVSSSKTKKGTVSNVVANATVNAEASSTSGASATPNSAAIPMIGEVIVDSDTLYLCREERWDTFNNGVALSPTLGAPGIAALQLPPLEPAGWWQKLRTRRARASLRPTVYQGRAVQAGGINLQVTRDGVEHPRLVESVTFYRHLRDAQFVRYTHND